MFAEAASTASTRFASGRVATATGLDSSPRGALPICDDDPTLSTSNTDVTIPESSYARIDDFAADADRAVASADDEGVYALAAAMFTV